MNQPQNQPTDLAQRFVWNFFRERSKAIESKVLPLCSECGFPFDGPDYGYLKTHICGPCNAQLGREDEAVREQNWKEANRE